MQRVKGVHARSNPTLVSTGRARVAPWTRKGPVAARLRRMWLLFWLFAALAPAVGAAPFENTMAQRMLACTGCHGKDGRAVGNVYFPRIAGKPAGYLLNQLRNFRDGRRSSDLMIDMIGLLSDNYLQEIAQYFSALDLPYPAPSPLTLSSQQAELAQGLISHGDARRKLAACTGCHGAALTGVLPHVPGLLGLPRDYINAQLGAWKTRQRHATEPDCMAQVARALTVDEVAAISAWLSAQPLPVNTHAVVAEKLATTNAPRPICGSAPELEAARR